MLTSSNYFNQTTKNLHYFDFIKCVGCNKLGSVPGLKALQDQGLQPQSQRLASWDQWNALFNELGLLWSQKKIRTVKLGYQLICWPHYNLVCST
jgi:hypothetical protein